MIYWCGSEPSSSTRFGEHLTEYGWIAPKGPSHVTMLADLIEEEEMANSLPEAALAMFRLMLDLSSPASMARSRISTRRSRDVLARTMYRAGS